MVPTLFALCLIPLFMFATAFLGRRWLYCWRKRNGKSHLGFYPSFAAAGNAFQSLQALAQPQVELMVEEKLKEPAEEEDESGDDDPLGSPASSCGRHSKRKKSRPPDGTTEETS